MKAIVVATAKGRENWLADCLESLKYSSYPIIVCDEGNYELGKIKTMMYKKDIDEFIFLQDSMIIKDYKWIDEAFEHDGSVGFGWYPFFMYLGKYRRSVLESIHIPDVINKFGSVVHEQTWTKLYFEADPSTKRMMMGLTDTDIFEFRHGRNNMVIENDSFIKYKGTWSLSMVKEK